MAKINKERYRIQGKIYYKEAEEDVSSADKGLVDDIWQMSNPKGEKFRLLIRRGKSSTYIMYNEKGDRMLKTYSISRVEVKDDN